MTALGAMLTSFIGNAVKKATTYFIKLKMSF